MIGQSDALDRAQALAAQVDQLVQAWARACQDLGLPIRVEARAFLSDTSRLLGWSPGRAVRLQAALGHTEPRLYLSLEAYCGVEGCGLPVDPAASSNLRVEGLGVVRNALARVLILAAGGCHHLRQAHLVDSETFQCALGLALVEGA